MEYAYLSKTVKIKTVSESESEGTFEVEGLYVGYGITIGNALRRVLLSSLPGAAIVQIKIKGVEHEFSTIPGVQEDVVEITLNLKKVRFKFHAEEPQVLSLKVKGERTVVASDIKGAALVEVANPDAHIATITEKGASLEMEITVEKGLGYVPTEARKMERLPIKTIALDAIFTPVRQVNFAVENMRVGERTDYNRLKLFIETDGTITPSSALKKAVSILRDHFDKIAAIEVKNVSEAKPAKSVLEKPSKAKTARKKKSEKSE